MPSGCAFFPLRPLLFAAILALALGACSSSPKAPKLTMTEQESGTTERLIGLDAKSDHVVWAAGTGGTYTRTTDGGETWAAGTVPDADTLQFRDVHVASPDTVYLLSIGSGKQSRIYKTTDGGRSWRRSFTNPAPEAFFDCMDFWTADHGIVFSDAVDGQFYLMETTDGGDTWDRIPPGRLPSAQRGEASFAASGTCLVTVGDSTAYVGTGTVDTARVVRTTDRGRTWTAHGTPIAAGAPTAGIASIAFRNAQQGAALGGIITVSDPPDSTVANVAVTNDAGATWSLQTSAPLPGIFGGAYVPESDTPTLVVVGPTGIAVSHDNGGTWAHVTDESHWSVTVPTAQAGWAVGPDGRITKLAFQ